MSSLDTVEDPDAILCRTNGGAIAEILALLTAGVAARDLQAGRRTIHRAFQQVPVPGGAAVPFEFRNAAHTAGRTRPAVSTAPA
ncbi:MULTISPECIES: hypothetical protein [unclassified Amycolatopsis]|uniref:hypothetical protein n=1 Tax=unclassified Amycolatopsis TaxID=2618356 RepID=UPI0021057BB2|nr:hypothetical protein [Amycolatopsis sp. DSM 110486]